MTISLSAAKIGMSIVAELANSLDGRIVTDTIRFGPDNTLTNGTGANQANEAFFDRRTLTASSTENLDLAGGLTDAFGTTLAFTKIRALAVYAAAANTNNVLVGGAASAQFSTWVGDVTDVVVVRPGGLFLLTAPDATGLAVTATTADLLKIANSSSGTSVTYDICIIGTV